MITNSKHYIDKYYDSLDEAQKTKVQRCYDSLINKAQKHENHHVGVAAIGLMVHELVDGNHGSFLHDDITELAKDAETKDIAQAVRDIKKSYKRTYGNFARELNLNIQLIAAFRAVETLKYGGQA